MHPLIPLAVFGLAGAALASSPNKSKDSTVQAFRRAIVRLAGQLHVPVPRVTVRRGLANANSDGQQINVDPNWLRERIKLACGATGMCRDDVIVGLAAHELAHHVFRDVRVPATQLAARRTNELRADFVAGWAAARLGCPGVGFEAFLVRGSTVCGSHPLWPSRLAARQCGARSAHRPLHQALAEVAPWFSAEAASCPCVRGTARFV